MGSTHCVEYPRNARFCRITGKSLPIVHNVAEAFLSALLDRLTLPCTVEGDQPVLVALLESRGTPNRSVNSKDECTFYETPFPRLAYIEAVEMERVSHLVVRRYGKDQRTRRDRRLLRWRPHFSQTRRDERG
jgi:hypothetical protein